MPRPIVIALVGTHTDARGQSLTLSQADLDGMVQEFAEPFPFVPNHPRDNHPQLGRGLKVQAEPGRLLCVDYGVEPVFKDLVQSTGVFNKVSARFLLPGHPRNPGKFPKIDHLGFLAPNYQPQMVKEPVEFGADEQMKTFELEFGWDDRLVAETFQRLREWFIRNQSQEVADQVIPLATINYLLDEATRDDLRPLFDQSMFGAAAVTQEKEQEQDFAAREAALQQQEAEFAKRQAALDAQDFGLRVKALHADGRPVPAELATAVYLALDSGQTVEFGAEKAQKSARALLLELLALWPKSVQFGAVAGDPLDESTSPEQRRQAALNARYKKTGK